MEKKLIVLFEIVRKEGDKKYELEKFEFNPYIANFKKVDSLLEEGRLNRLAMRKSGPNMIKEINIVGFQII